MLDTCSKTYLWKKKIQSEVITFITVSTTYMRAEDITLTTDCQDGRHVFRILTVRYLYHWKQHFNFIYPHCFLESVCAIQEYWSKGQSCFKEQLSLKSDQWTVWARDAGGHLSHPAHSVPPGSPQHAPVPAAWHLSNGNVSRFLLHENL